MQDLKERKSDNALLAVRELNYEENGDLIFSAPPKKVMQVQFVVDELAMMAADLDELRASNPPVRLTEEQMAELENERVGAEFSESPYNY